LFSEQAPQQGHKIAKDVNTEENLWQNWYEDYIHQFDYEPPKQGQIIEGEIVSIAEDSILVEVGLKRTGIVPNRDLNLLDEEYLKSLSVGDSVHVCVLRQGSGDQDLLVSIHKGLEHKLWKEVEFHKENETILELPVVGMNRGGLIMQYKSLRAFMPFSHIPELKRVRDRNRSEAIKRDLVGKTLQVKVIEIHQDRNRIILSAQDVLEEQRRKQLEALEKGQVLQGKVVGIVDFGVFVNLGSLDGLVHISELAWQPVKHPSDLVKVGDEMEVQVLDVNLERERISLSRKALIPGPFDQFAEAHQVGETIEGCVTHVVKFGAFVELAPGVEGLVHTSEFGYSDFKDPKEVIHPGEKVLVRILKLDPERRRVSLSMRDVPLERQLAWTMETM
jgi:small subunit ribosomal protein S1